MTKLVWPGNAGVVARDTFPMPAWSVTDWRVLCGAAGALSLLWYFVAAYFVWRRNPTLGRVRWCLDGGDTGLLP